MRYFSTYKLKDILRIFLFCTILALLLILSKENFDSVKSSIAIFLSSVVPSLFPFIFFTEFVLNLKIINTISSYFGKVISKIFCITKNATPAIIIGFLCGFPMGAKTVAILYENNKISKIEAEKLLQFVNNCNPAFLISTIGIGVFYNIKIGIILAISHYLSAIIFCFLYSNNLLNTIILKKQSNSKSLSKTLVNLDKKIAKHTQKIGVFENIRISIANTFKNLGIILGFIIIFNLLFNVIELLLQKLNIDKKIISILSGIFEITNGSNNIYNTNITITIKICIISFIVGFSGICILCQIYSTVYKHGFSFKKIILSKFIQGILSFVITYIILSFVNISDILSQGCTSNITIDVFSLQNSNIDYLEYINILKASYLNSIFFIIFILSTYLFIFNFIINKNKESKKIKKRYKKAKQKIVKQKNKIK
ncbi:MAG: hypothetical protein RSG48_00525 [Clostridia bacterium]